MLKPMKDTFVEICKVEDGLIDAVNFEEYAQLCEKHGIKTSHVMPTSYWEPDAYERNVIGTVFSKATKLSEYKEQIPLRVLQELDVAKERNLCDYYYIVAPAGSPDPLLVGSKQDNTYSLFGNPFTVIARWGSYLPTFEEMEKIAIDIVTIKVADYCTKIDMQSNSIKRNPEATAKAILHGTPISTVYYS
jgi:hypothetical protein